MILKRKLFAEEEKSDAKTAAGVGVAGAGAIGLSKMDKSELTGRIKRYHATDEGNIQSIKDSGLKASRANGETFTKKVLDHIPEEELNNKVYMGKKKSVAESVGKKRTQMGHGKQGMVNIEMDYDEWKKLKKVENPELLGAKNSKEYVKRLLKQKGKTVGLGTNYDTLSKGQQIVMDAIGKQAFKTLGEEGTEVIEGDVASKFIKGGKGYEKNSIKKVAKYVKNNPGRFAKGVGKAALATGAVGAGAYVAGKEMKKNKKD